jgi:hypothetical protein
LYKKAVGKAIESFFAGRYLIESGIILTGNASILTPPAKIGTSMYFPGCMDNFGDNVSIFALPAAVLAIGSPIIGIAFLPLSLGLALIGLVIRIISHFTALPLSPPCPLAGGLTAIVLIFDARICRQQTPTIRTCKCSHGDALPADHSAEPGLTTEEKEPVPEEKQK